MSSEAPSDPTTESGDSTKIKQEASAQSPSHVLNNEDKMAGISTQSTEYNPPVSESEWSDEAPDSPAADSELLDLEDILNAHFPNVKSHQASSSLHKPGQERGETSETSEQHLQVAALPPKKARKTVRARNAEASAEVAFEFEQSMRVGLERFLGVLETSSDADDSELEYVQTDGKRKSAHSKRRTSRKKSRKQPGFLNEPFHSLITSSTLIDAANNRATSPKPPNDELDTDAYFDRMVEGLPMSDPLRQDKNYLKECVKILGRGRKITRTGDDKWSIEGMESSLPHHQVQGAAFMKRRETEDTAPFGGICADTMGLGKTLETIALMTCNPSKRIDKAKCTLIVAHSSLVDQWEAEIEKHALHSFPRIVVHKAPNLLKDSILEMTLGNADVFLTTYHEVVKSFPKAEPPEDLTSPEGLTTWWKDVWREDRGMLHKEFFYRIILDESQVIKNHRSWTSTACRALTAKHRWTLSGTPIANEVQELCPYFKFLRLPRTGSFANFEKNLCTPDDKTYSRLRHLLDRIMIRRTMATKVCGRPIIELPSFTQHSENIKFGPVEQVLYDILLRRFVAHLNQAAEKEELDKHKGLMLAMYMLLRQCTAHVFQAQHIFQEMLTLDSIAKFEEAAKGMPRTSDQQPDEMIAALRRLIEAKGESCQLADEDYDTTTGGLSYKLGKYLQGLIASGNFAKFQSEILCQLCKKQPQLPMVTSCLHVYCGGCVGELASKAAAKGFSQSQCSTCSTKFRSTEFCVNVKELEITDPFRSIVEENAKKKPRKVVLKWVLYEGKLLLSTKTLAVQAQIRDWFEDDPKQKIIVFSQFHMTMQILGKMCEMNDWDYCNYHGKMTNQQRAKALIMFKDPKCNKRIMVASLHCGSIGLNLTSASRVILVDLWFNRCAEDQAFGRVFRIGQSKETALARILIKDSVDERLDNMQQIKQQNIAHAIGDRELLSKMPTLDMLKLFGDVKMDGKSRKMMVDLEKNDLIDSLVPLPKEGEIDPIIPLIGKFA